MRRGSRHSFVVIMKIDAIVGSNSAETINTEDSARVQVGSVVCNHWLLRQFCIGSASTTGQSTWQRRCLRGESRESRLGNAYGGRGLCGRLLSRTVQSQGNREHHFILI